AAPANHGLDLLSGCCSLGPLGCRQASIPLRCLSNAIICDLKRRMSSIRRSSLISITFGLLTVIGGYLSFASLEETAGQCLECPLEPCIRARRYGAGRPVLSWRWRLGPARFGRYRKSMGVWGASVSTARVAYDASGLGSCDIRHKLLFE